MSVEEAKEVLENAGYYMWNLWHITDVKRHADIDDTEAMHILDDALANDWIIEQINTTIVDCVIQKQE